MTASWVLDPLLTSCGWCPAWEVACATEAEKLAVEERHRAKFHAGVVEDVHDVTDRMLGERPDERDLVIATIIADARAHGGHVDQNRVRDSLPAGITPQIVGPVYSALMRSGRLVRDGKNISTDKAGRNVGKEQWTYLLVTAQDGAA